MSLGFPVSQALTPVGISQAAKTLVDAIGIARNVYRNLPDIKKEKNLARSTFERKINMPQKKNGRGSGKTVTSNQSVNRSLIDVSRTQTGAAQRQRSTTGSRVMSYDNQNARIPRGLPGYLDKIRVCFRASTPLVNNNIAGGSASYAYALAVQSAATDVSEFMPQLLAMQSLFREFRFLKVKADFVPRLGSTSAGIVACCVDRDPRAVQATTSTIIRKDPFFECDIKQPGSLTWVPVDDEDRRFRYCYDATRPIEFLSHGMLLITSSNDLANLAVVGELFMDVWIEYAIPL